MLQGDETDHVSSRQIMSGDEVRRALTRMGHEIVEKHGGTADLAFVGIERRGPAIAARIATVIAERYEATLPVASIDASRYRDDIGGPQDAASAIDEPRPLPFDLARSTVILVDDVLFTGRTVRAAIDALIARGRPAAIRLAVLIDRGHRELPIRADHVGKNVPTARDELVDVRLTDAGMAGVAEDAVRLLTADEARR